MISLIMEEAYMDIIELIMEEAYMDIIEPTSS